MERLIHSNKIGTVINFFHNAKVTVIKEKASSQHIKDCPLQVNFLRSTTMW